MFPINLAISVLSDEFGISEKSWEILKKELVELEIDGVKEAKLILDSVKVTDGYYYLPEDFSGED